MDKMDITHSKPFEIVESLPIDDFLKIVETNNRKQ